MTNKTTKRIWTRDETIFALALYFQLPYGQLDARTPKVIEMAKILGRKASSLSMKMCNLARLDPTLQKRQISGLSHGANLEVSIWNEFYLNQDLLAQEYHRIITELKGSIDTDNSDDSLLKTPPGLDKEGITHYRINQTFFRNSVLSAYDGKCCITGIKDKRLLIASHIKPWAKCLDGNEKTNAQNGLCLNALHDRAFDKGLITIDDQFIVRISSKLREMMSEYVFLEYFGQYEGKTITMPRRLPPDPMFLKFHRENIFIA